MPETDLIELPGFNEILADPMVYDDEMDVVEETYDAVEFYQNLTDQISEDTLNRIGQDLCAEIENDRLNREKYMESVTAALESMGMDGGVDASETDDDLSAVKHVLLNEACGHAESRIMAEIHPAEGPVRAKVWGGADQTMVDQAKRVEEYLNWQLLEDIDGYFETLERALKHLTLTGTVGLKVCWDPVDNKPSIEFVPVEKLIVSTGSKNLQTSKRYTHEYFLTRNEYRQYVAVGYYADVDGLGDGMETPETISEEVVGLEHSVEEIDDNESGDGESAKDQLTFLDVYTYHKFKGLDDLPDGDDMIQSPYIITIDKDSQKVVAVRRNWSPDDPIRRKAIQSILEYVLFPGLDFYGNGFYQFIGGLDAAATSALRGNLRAAARALEPAGFVSGNVQGGQVRFNPGTYMKVRHGGSDEIAKNIHHIPTMPPDQTMLAIMVNMEENVRRFSHVTDFQIGDASKGNMPVGTTLAMIEEGQKSLTGMHKRLHHSQKKLFKMLARLNWIYGPPEFSFTTMGNTQVMSSEDFNPNTIDVVPVSDPNISSASHRITMMQEVYGLAVNHPDIVDLKASIVRILEAMKIPNIEEILVDASPPPRTSALHENRLAMSGQPIMAYEDQVHDAHIQVHMAFFNDPTLAQNPFGEQAVMALAAHVAEHIGMYYWQQAQMALGLPIGFDQELDPETEAQISMMAAQWVAQSPQVRQIAAVAEAGTDPQLELAIQKGQIELEIMQAKGQQDIQGRQQKLIDDAEGRKAKLEADMREIALKSQVNANTDQQNTALKIQNLEQTHQIQMDIARREAAEDMRQEMQAHIQEMKADWEKHKQDMAMEREEMRVKLEGEKAKMEIEKKKAEEQVKAMKEQNAEKKKGLFGGSKDK